MLTTPQLPLGNRPVFRRHQIPQHICRIIAGRQPEVAARKDWCYAQKLFGELS
jgi:hypothetical protein